MPERERLIARIRQVRRASKAADEAAKSSAASPEQDPLAALEDEAAKSSAASPEQDPLAALEVRIAHLEALVEGLQDSVHRESSRQARRITEIEARIEPSTLGRALSDDARERGL